MIRLQVRDISLRTDAVQFPRCRGLARKFAIPFLKHNIPGSANIFWIDYQRHPIDV